jgi:hypothetical protein
LTLNDYRPGLKFHNEIATRGQYYTKEIAQPDPRASNHTVGSTRCNKLELSACQSVQDNGKQASRAIAQHRCCRNRTLGFVTLEWAIDEMSPACQPPKKIVFR